jgi:hypothetical protein
MTNAKIEESLGRLSALKWFPTNPHALVAIAEILRDLCPSDNDATALVHGMLGEFGEWPGPEGLRKTNGRILEIRRAAERERKLREMYVQAGAARKDHEATCPGYVIELNTEERTVNVAVCCEGFGSPDIERWHWLRCRKGEALTAEFIQDTQAAELAARPEWISRNEKWSRLWRAKRDSVRAV